MNGFDEQEPTETLEEIGLNTRFATAAERPGFYTEERVTELVSGPRLGITPEYTEFVAQRANARVRRAFIEKAIEQKGEDFCDGFPEAGGCVLPIGFSGEARIPRPGSRAPSEGDTIQLRPGVRVPKPRTVGITDISEYLRSRFAEEAQLKARTAFQPDDRERAELARELATEQREGFLRLQEEAYHALTPTQRQRAGVMLLPGGGVGPRIVAGAGSR